MRNRARLAATTAVVTVVAPLAIMGASPAGATTMSACPTSTGQRIVNTPAAFPKTVALTFDDGPDPTWTPQVLAVLAKHHVHATFFVIGKRATAHPDVLEQVVDAGHMVGNHTWNHPTKGNGMYALTDAQLVTEFAPTTALIKDITGRPVCFFRAPQGKDNSSALRHEAQQRGQTVTGYFTASDYQQPGKMDPVWVDQIVQRLTDRGPHPILLLHDGGGSFRGNSVEALDAIITWYVERGYVFTDPAGRPFPGEVPSGTNVPATGWAVPPNWTPPDDGLAKGSPTPTNLPGLSAAGDSDAQTSRPTSGNDAVDPTSGARRNDQSDRTRTNRRLAKLAAGSGQNPLAACQVTDEVARYLMVFSAPQA